jgi:hypothetical protein
MLGIPIKALQIKTKGIRKKLKDSHGNSKYEKAVHFGLVFTMGDKNKHEDVKFLVKSLEKDGKKVNALAYLPKNTENHEFMFNFFTIKDLGFWGTLESDSISQFISQKYDYLILLDLDIHPLTENILTRTKSHFRVGRYVEGKEYLFDLMLHSEPNDGQKKYFEQILHYIKLLNNDEA